MMIGYGMMGLFGLVGMLFSALIIAGIVVLIVWAVRRSSDWGNRPTGGQTPREIAQARYARGEITREQYQQLLDDLK
ncbi:MAG: SHOCT domain-containing protein [Bacteroidota bacterium]